jgi:hypothetical protein
MNRINNDSRKFCFISNSEQSYLADYINLSANDLVIDFSFNNINLSELKGYEPNMIIIDEYFKDEDYKTIIDSIKMNFKHVKIYFLSPEYSDYNGIIQSINNQNHYFSNFSIEIISHINDLTGNSSNDYLEAN